MPAYLSEQQVPDPAHREVGGAALHQALLPPVQQFGQEAGVPLQQLVQTGEDGVNHARLQHHLLLHPPPVHPLHDPQRPHVVELRLDELWETERVHSHSDIGRQILFLFNVKNEHSSSLALMFVEVISS